METILKALEKLNIENYRITERLEETSEIFFVKKELDTRRAKDTKKYTVTVYRDGEGKKTRGCSDAAILPSDTEKEIEEKLSGAYYAANFAQNPFYELPDAVKAPKQEKKGELAEKPLAESVGKMAKALFAPDTRNDSFINSAEIFASRTYTRIVSSNGTDVSYTDAKLDGEFVVQCKEPEDVEMYFDFSYDECDTESLSKKVAEALEEICDRANAKKVLKSGKYDLILCKNEVSEVLSYYLERSFASMIYPHYSTWKVGDTVQGDEIAGEKLAMTLKATVPYSAEGIPMKDLPLIDGGKLLAIHGTNQHCRYLNIKPTGNYTKFVCENAGSESFDEMKKNPCLVAVAFSDFQMDSFSGHFGGEIRLAYLIENGKVTPVTGGSVNGSLIEAQSNLAFSTDRYSSAEYEGPYAMLIKGVNVAGI